MKSSKFLSLLLIVFSAGTSLKASADVWRIASLEWPPYAGSQLDDGGTAIAKLRSLLSPLGIQLEVDYMPWQRAQVISTANDYVGYFPAWPEEVRSGFMPSEPISTSIVGVIEHRENPISWTSVSDLFERHKIGFVSSYVYPKELQTKLDAHSLQTLGAENESDLARILAAKRIDAALTDPKVLKHFADQILLENTIGEVVVLHEHPLVLAFSKTDQVEEKIKLLNRQLSASDRVK